MSTRAVGANDQESSDDERDRERGLMQHASEKWPRRHRHGRGRNRHPATILSAMAYGLLDDVAVNDVERIGLRIATAPASDPLQVHVPTARAWRLQVGLGADPAVRHPVTSSPLAAPPGPERTLQLRISQSEFGRVPLRGVWRDVEALFLGREELSGSAPKAVDIGGGATWLLYRTPGSR